MILQQTFFKHLMLSLSEPFNLQHHAVAHLVGEDSVKTSLGIREWNHLAQGVDLVVSRELEHVAHGLSSSNHGSNDLSFPGNNVEGVEGQWLIDGWQTNQAEGLLGLQQLEVVVDLEVGRSSAQNEVEGVLLGGHLLWVG